MLPFVAYHYHLAENLLSYADSERDLGVHVNKSFNFNEHCEKLLTKANQQLGILKRNCHFVINKYRRRVLYLNQTIIFNQTIILLLTAQIKTYLYDKNHTQFYHYY